MALVSGIGTKNKFKKMAESYAIPIVKTQIEEMISSIGNNT